MAAAEVHRNVLAFFILRRMPIRIIVAALTVQP
jgi:hypothetical protein